MELIIKITKYITVILLGLLFLFSAYSKLIIIEQFEIQLVEYGIINWDLSKYLSRILLSIEFFVGFLLLFHINVKRLALPLSFLLLIVFTLFSLYQLIFIGETENCGCFGDLVKFSFKETIVKNSLMLILTLLSYRFIKFKEWFIPKRTTLVSILILIFSIQLVVIIQPPFDVYGQVYNKVVEENTEFPKQYKNDKISKEWFEGSKLLVFVSPGCKYCKQVARKMRVIYPYKDYSTRILFVFSDISEEEVENFYEVTGVEFERAQIEKSEFLKITKGRFPQLFYLNDGVLIRNIGKQEFFDEKMLF